MEKNRLSKILAQAGVCARRKAEELIFEGKVTVNGEVILTPQTFVDPEKDKICVAGKPIEIKESKFYFILNKPKNYVCSAVSKPNNPSVLLLFKGVKARLFPVGRLDKDTTGLLLVTNDGAFANKVIHPSSNITKQYIATADQEITPAHIEQMYRGIRIEGTLVRPKKIIKMGRKKVSVTVSEGKNKEVRRLLQAAGLTCLDLRRIRIGGLDLGSLPLGSYRNLSDKEKDKIFN